MSRTEKDLWQGLAADGRKRIVQRSYKEKSFEQRLAGNGVDAGELARADHSKGALREAWIPGVEIFARTIHPQRHRGIFGELGREREGTLARIGFWPTQWATARMYANTAKGFHVHPPDVSDPKKAAGLFRKMFVEEADDYSRRTYDTEQWDVIFFVQGLAEMILRDVRAGLPSRVMRFFIDGDNHRGPNNVGIVVPPGVAHAIRVEGSEDLIMVYGTSTSFRAEFEGRIGSEIETSELPDSWQKFLG